MTRPRELDLGIAEQRADCRIGLSREPSRGVCRFLHAPQIELAFARKQMERLLNRSFHGGFARGRCRGFSPGRLGTRPGLQERDLITHGKADSVEEISRWRCARLRAQRSDQQPQPIGDEPPLGRGVRPSAVDKCRLELPRHSLAEPIELRSVCALHRLAQPPLVCLGGHRLQRAGPHREKAAAVVDRDVAVLPGRIARG